jgi:hypothetical protein
MLLSGAHKLEKFFGVIILEICFNNIDVLL